MKETIIFLGLQWEVIGEIRNLLEEKYFRFLSDKNGNRAIVVHTEKWSPNWGKNSPKFRKCYGKHLMKFISPRKEDEVVKKLIHTGYKPESEVII